MRRWHWVGIIETRVQRRLRLRDRFPTHDWLVITGSGSTSTNSDSHFRRNFEILGHRRTNDLSFNFPFAQKTIGVRVVSLTSSGGDGGGGLAIEDRQWGQVTPAATRLATRDPVRWLRLSFDAFPSFPFGRPGSASMTWRGMTGAHWTCSAPVRRLPRLTRRGPPPRGLVVQPRLCAGRDVGRDLERSGTLVGGASCCDFRFRAADPDDAQPELRLPMAAP